MSTTGDSPCVTLRVTMTCPVCGRTTERVGRRRYCSPACRQTAFRRRQEVVPAAPLPRVPRAHVVYECPSCEERYIGVQRCEECQLFCRRVGVGGACPSCDEPVAISDLLATSAVR